MKKVRWRIFGMEGTWDEFNDYTYTRSDAYAMAYRHLIRGHDVRIENIVSGKIVRLKLRGNA